MLKSIQEHQLLTHSSIGYVCYKIIFDQNDPQDYLFEDFNFTFEELMDIKPHLLRGQKLSKIIQKLDNCHPAWLELYHQTVVSQKSQRTISYVSSLEKWIEVQTHLVAKRYLIGLFTVIDKNDDHDHLTSLYNRAYFEKLLEHTNSQHLLPISIMMGDVNGLKLTNDVFGHDAGDQLLRQIADVLKQTVAPNHTVARWGGDEFVILLPNTSQSQADAIREKIYNACRDANSKPIELSISIGIASKTNLQDNIFDSLRNAEDNMYANKLVESKKFRDSIIKSLHKILYERTNETPGHTQRVTNLALKLGKKLELSETFMDQLRSLGALHDIGKIAIKESVFTKSGTLTPKEWRSLKKHPEIGYRIAQASPELVHIAEGILSHHEHWDGSGYPQGLSGRKIPLIARIVTIADAYDVMTHSQVYKNALTPEQAIEELKAKSGTQFEPFLVDRFIEIIVENTSSQ